jgi:hypothetical protein
MTSILAIKFKKNPIRLVLHFAESILQESYLRLIMTFILSAFKLVSVTFAISAVATGVQAIIDPIGFSRSFGLPITDVKDSENSKLYKHNGSPIPSYVSLMGVRQLASGMILLTFAWQGKWIEMATILVILGIVVAGTDGYHLSCSGARSLGVFHALPGALIATLAGAVILTTN